MNLRNAPVLVPVVCLALTTLGCGGPVAVEGTVTFEGQPLEEATVLFHPTDGSAGASALTDAKGAFRLIGTQKDGIAPGEYRVTVSKKEFPPGLKPADPTKLTIPLVEKMQETLPLAYTLPDRTPLRVTVPRGGQKDVRLTLNKQGS
jgi:hypothetical protein